MPMKALVTTRRRARTSTRVRRAERLGDHCVRGGALHGLLAHRGTRDDDQGGRRAHHQVGDQRQTLAGGGDHRYPPRADRTGQVARAERRADGNSPRNRQPEPDRGRGEAGDAGEQQHADAEEDFWTARRTWWPGPGRGRRASCRRRLRRSQPVGAEVGLFATRSTPTVVSAYGRQP